MLLLAMAIVSVVGMVLWMTFVLGKREYRWWDLAVMSVANVVAAFSLVELTGYGLWTIVISLAGLQCLVVVILALFRAPFTMRP
jgi:hypothetical protein